MLSSLGFTPKGASRGSHNGSRLFNAPQGFSVHVFKNPTLSSHSHSPPSTHSIPVTGPKADSAQQTRPSTNGPWTRQTSYHGSHDPERKQLLAAPASQQLVHVPGAHAQAWPVETKQSKSQRSYGIYPSLTSDIYIYERSISSVSFDDELASSPSSDSSSSGDSDLAYRTATINMRSVEISSTRASSSTETLESTLAAPGTVPVNVASVLPPPPPPAYPLALAAPARATSTRTRTESVVSAVPAPLIRVDSHVQQFQRTVSGAHPHAIAPLFELDHDHDDSDSETVISDSLPNDMVVDMAGGRWQGPTQSYPYPIRSQTPFLRHPDDRVSAPAPAATTHRRDAPAQREREPAPVRLPSTPPRTEDPRAPPGLGSSPPRPQVPATATAPVASGSSPRLNPPRSSSPPSSVPPSLARAPSSRQSPPGSQPGPQPRHAADMGLSSVPPSSAASSFPPPSSSPPRRDGRPPSPQRSPTTATPYPSSNPTSAAQPQGSPTAAAGGALVVAAIAKRSVRWTENLVCPSPVPPEMRRKGWFNRRGDQLWTNDGQYKVPDSGAEYPPDLASYPEPNSGWMNEEGVRIDMQHRLVPKQPLRPALKRPKQQQQPQPLNA